MTNTSTDTSTTPGYAASVQPSLGRVATNDEAASLAVSTRTAPTPRVNPDAIPSGTTPSDANDPLWQEKNKELNDAWDNGKRLSEISAYAQSLNDSISSKYAVKEKSDTDANTAAEMRARTLNTRSGLTDSGTGESAVATVKDKGAKVIQADEAAKNAEIGVALGKVDQLQADQAKAYAAQKANDLKTYNDLRTNNIKTATDSLTSFAKSNVDLATLKQQEPATYATLQKELGLSDLEMTAKFNALKGANAAKLNYKVVGDKIIAYGADATGKLVEQEETVPGLSEGHFEIKELKDGTILKFNKDSGEYTKLYNTPGSDTPVPPSKADLSGAAEWMRAQPDYKPEYEKTFKNDPVIQAKVIQAWKASKKSTPSSTNPFDSSPAK